MKSRSKDKLLCDDCGETCGPSKGCDLYLDSQGRPTIDNTDHLHVAGGSDVNGDYYGLCQPCLEKFYLRHRPTDSDGKWKWLDICELNCKFCRLLQQLPWKQNH